MANKSISTIQTKQVLDSTHYLLVSGSPTTVYAIEGEVNSTTGTAYYIQLIGVAAPSSGVTIPLYSRLCVAAAQASGINGFSFTYNPPLDTSVMNAPGGSTATNSANTLPVYAAISSTDNVYTAVAASTQVTVVIEDPILEQIVPNQTVTGDTVTGVDSLQVWADNATTSPAKRLVRVQVSNSDATAIAPVYLMLFGYSGPAAGATPLQQWQISTTALTSFFFGDGVEIQQGNPTTLAPTYGCFLYGSSTTQTLTATAATHWTMKAWNV